MRESLLKAEDKYLKEEDGESSRDRESCRYRYKNSDSDSSDEDDYSKKPKNNSIRIRCEECIGELTQKNYGRHIQSLKHKKNERIYNRNKVIEDTNEAGEKVTNKDKENS